MLMPTAMKNRPEQQALEGLDVGLQLAPVLAVGQQHAGQEGAQRHRQAQPLHQRAMPTTSSSARR
jgi:hypothetical protein